MRNWLVIPGALLLLSACASSGAKGSATRPDRNVITSEEIRKSPEHSAFNLIRSLRPGMLHQRGNTSLSNRDPGIVVFLDGQLFGALSSLDGMETATIQEIRYINAGEAQARFGTGYPQGAILITSRTR
jgi:hypothetical protein